MILFKVSFQNNTVSAVVASTAYRSITWKENPYSIQTIDVYANNNIDAMQLAQQKANLLLTKNK